MRRPLVIYDSATAPFLISLYMRKIWLSFYQCGLEFVYIEESGRYGWKNFESHFVNLQECNPSLSWYREFSKAFGDILQLSAVWSSHAILQNRTVPQRIHIYFTVGCLCLDPDLDSIGNDPDPSFKSVFRNWQNVPQKKKKKNLRNLVLWRAIPTTWSLLLELHRVPKRKIFFFQFR